MSFLAHIGATAYKYEVELTLLNLRLSAIATAPLWIEWKRGSSFVKTPTVTGEKGLYDFGKRAMKIQSTMYKKKDRFQKKEMRLTVKQNLRGKETVVGYVDLDLANYVKTSDVSESMTLNLQKSLDRQARLTFRLNTHWLKGAEITSDDEMSRSTNFSTVAGSNENSLNESPASRDVNDLDALEQEDDSDDEHDRDSENEPRERSRHGDDEEDEDEEDAARRKVQFSKSKLGRTSTSSGDQPAPSQPKKSALKTPTPSPPAPAPQPPTSSRRAAAAASKDSDSEDDHDRHDGGEEEENIPFFGVTVQQIMDAQADSFPDLDIPVIMDVLLRGIERTGGFNTEGIFRVSPLNKARDELRAAFERGEYQLPKDPTISAAVLKYWFAELKETIFTEKLTPKILEVGKLPPPSTPDADDDDSESDSDSDEEYTRKSSRRANAKKTSGQPSKEVADGLKSVLTKLPPLNLRVIHKLVTFLGKVAAQSSKNRMTPKALAVVFAPNLVKLPMPDARARNAADQMAQDMKRVVNFVEHLFTNVQLVDQAMKGELDSPTNGASKSNSSSAASTSKSSTTSSKKKPPPPPESDEDEEDDDRDHDDDPIPSFAHSVDLGSLSDELEEEQVKPPPKKGKAAAAAAAEEEKKQASTSKKPAPKSTRGRGQPSDDDDDSEEEEEKRRELYRRKGVPDSVTSPTTTATGNSIKDQLFAKKSPAAAAPAASTTTAAGKKPSKDSDSDSDSDEDAPPQPTKKTPNSTGSSNASKKPMPKDDTDDSDEDDRPAPASSSVKDQLFAKRASASNLNGGASKKDDAPPKSDASKKTPSPPTLAVPSARSAFGEEDDDDDADDTAASESDYGAPSRNAHGFDQSETSDEESTTTRASNGRRPQPPPPQPSPSPRSAVAALSAAAAARATNKATSPRENTSSSAASAAAAATAELEELRAQVASLTQEKTNLAKKVSSLESELTSRDSDDSVALVQAEKELKRLKSENVELTKTLAATSSSSSSSKAVESLKKQVASLVAEKDDLNADYDELEARYTELRKTSQDQKKQLKALESEIEDLKDQLIEATAAASKSSSSSSKSPSASRSNGLASSSSSASSLDAQQLREEFNLLQLQYDDLRADLTEKLESERKLTRSLQQQLQAAKTENDQLRQRDIKFEELNVIKSHLDPKKNAKDKLQMDLIAAYEESQKRIKFLTIQLKECEMTLVHAKTGFAMTVQVLQDQIGSLEGEIANLQQSVQDLTAQQPFDVQQYEMVQKKLRKSEQARTKMTEVLASMESELNKKKIELKTALQSIIDLQQDNAKIKEELVRSGLALKTIAETNFEMKEWMRLNAKGGKK